MILTIDIGNTQTCMGVFTDDAKTQKCLWRNSTVRESTINEIAVSLINVLAASDFGLQDITKICVACVVPSLTVVYTKAIASLIKTGKINAKLCVCNAKNAMTLPKEIYNCTYAHPEDSGPDIVASAIAAKVLYKNSVVIADMGTATNLNVIDKDGNLVSAIISAGLKTSLNALINGAGALAEIEIKAPEKLMGDSTEELIQSGTIIGEAAKIDGLVQRIEEELQTNVRVITTGGWSTLVSPYMKKVTEVRPNLVLEGMAIFANEFNG